MTAVYAGLTSSPSCELGQQYPPKNAAAVALFEIQTGKRFVDEAGFRAVKAH